MTGQLDIYTLVGFVGMACIIAAYAYLTWKDRSEPISCCMAPTSSVRGC